MMRLMLIALACSACISGKAAAEGLGRLFFTPAQRAQLDTARAQRDRRAAAAETTEAEQAAPQGPNIVTYDGMVRRNDGKSTVWINGKPITERTRDSDVNVLGVRRDGAVSVTVPQMDRSTALRVGQSIDVTSGTIEESYARRVTIPRPPPKPVPPAAPAGASTKPPAAGAAPAAAVQQTARRGEKEADPDSGAAPAVVRGTGK